MKIIIEDDILRVLVPTEKQYLKHKDDISTQENTPYLFKKAYLADEMGIDECMKMYEESNIFQNDDNLDIKNKQLKAQAYLNAKTMGVEVKISIEEKAELQIIALDNLEAENVVDSEKWLPGLKIIAGQIISHDNNKYECVQSHITQQEWEPPTTPALWKVVKNDSTFWIQPTGAHDAYQVGDTVTYNGQLWTSTDANNVWEPGVYGWKVI